MPDSHEVSVDIDDHRTAAWYLSLPRKLWFDFLSAAYAHEIGEHSALELALRRFIASARGEEPPAIVPDWPVDAPLVQ